MSQVFPKPCLMGILNVTPDSFSDGGQFYKKVEQAVSHAKRMSEQGASIIDVGGESTRPGSARVSADEQRRRVIAVIEQVAQQLPNTLISIDTTLSEVAAAAVAAGAGMVNDISAACDDPGILDLVAQKQLPICLMHKQGSPETMQDNPTYQDVVNEVCDFLDQRVEAAVRAGVSESQIILDPGIGFGKTDKHNITLLANLKQIVAMGFPVLLGTSRKRFISSIYESPNPQQRVLGSCVTTVLGLLDGVSIFRVHDVAEHDQVLSMTQAIQGL